MPQFQHTGDLTGNASKDWVSCPCLDCRVIERLGPRINEGHVGVRFDDRARGAWRILIDGEDVTNSCLEAMGGPHGWVLVHLHPPRVCAERPRHCCTTMYWGNVQIHMEMQMPYSTLTEP